MGCHVRPSNPLILSKIPTNKPKKTSPFSSFHPNFKTRKTISSLSSQYQIKLPLSETDIYAIKFKTLSNCKLGISWYPDFEYNAEGGIGIGTVRNSGDDDSDGDFLVSFDLETLYIPPLTSVTTKFLGLPLPPFLRIDIVPEVFQGIINKNSGKVDLEFKAKFLFSIASLYKAPPLVVNTLLTSEESKGKIRNGRGERMSDEGNCRLVGVAFVDPIDDFLLDSFLSLPTECLASMGATITFSST